MADIKKIAVALVRLSTLEMYALRHILEQEYGIKAKDDVVLRRELPSETVKIFEMKDNVAKAVVVEAKQRFDQKQRRYVPRVIGRPCKPYLNRRK